MAVTTADKADTRGTIRVPGLGGDISWVAVACGTHCGRPVPLATQGPAQACTLCRGWAVAMLRVPRPALRTPVVLQARTGRALRAREPGGGTSVSAREGENLCAG